MDLFRVVDMQILPDVPCYSDEGLSIRSERNPVHPIAVVGHTGFGVARSVEVSKVVKPDQLYQTRLYKYGDIQKAQSGGENDYLSLGVDCTHCPRTNVSFL